MCRPLLTWHRPSLPRAAWRPARWNPQRLWAPSHRHGARWRRPHDDAVGCAACVAARQRPRAPGKACSNASEDLSQHLRCTVAPRLRSLATFACPPPALRLFLRSTMPSRPPYQAPVGTGPPCSLPLQRLSAALAAASISASPPPQVTFVVYDDASPPNRASVNRTLVIVPPCDTGTYACPSGAARARLQATQGVLDLGGGARHARVHMRVTVCHTAHAFARRWPAIDSCTSHHPVPPCLAGDGSTGVVCSTIPCAVRAALLAPPTPPNVTLLLGDAVAANASAGASSVVQRTVVLPYGSAPPRSLLPCPTAADANSSSAGCAAVASDAAGNDLSADLVVSDASNCSSAAAAPDAAARAPCAWPCDLSTAGGCRCYA